MATTEQPTSSHNSSPSPSGATDFGANEWLVEDMYERFLADPGSVDAAWHDFFADYRPGRGTAGGNGNGSGQCGRRRSKATHRTVRNAPD